MTDPAQIGDAAPGEGRSDASSVALGMHAPLTADVLTEQMAVDDGRVFRTSRLSLHLDARQTQAINLAISVAEANGGRADDATVRAVGDAFRRDGFEDQLTDEGFWRGSVLAARTGTQEYSDGQSTWGEYRSPDEVGSPESLGSWALKPFTDDHPPVLLTTSNYRKFAVGSIGQDASLTEPQADGQRYVKVTILVGDLDTLRKIRDGKVELSAGYTVIPVEDAGVDPVSGAPFKFRQTKIRINHESLVDAGRAGPLARIEFDGSAWELPQPQGDAMADDKKDQLDPETSEMLLEATAAYIHPESPEAGEAALQGMANIMGLEPDAIRAKLSPDMPEPAAEPTVEPAAEPEESPTLMDVTLADGVTAKMTADAAAAWENHMSERATSNDAADAQRTNLDQQLAAQDAKISALERNAERLTSDLATRERTHLIDSVAAKCPDLVAGWRKLGTDAKILEACKPLTLIVDGKEIAESPMATMQRAIVCDLDPGAAEDFARATSLHARGWTNHVQSSFDTTIRLYTARAIAPTPDPRAPTLDYNQKLRLMHTGQTG